MTDEKPLYERDFIEWAFAQADALRDLQKLHPDAADWENLIEEVESLGRATIIKSSQHARDILTNALLLAFGEEDQLGRNPGEILEVQEDLALEITPSTRNRIDLAKTWANSCRIANSLLAKSTRALPADLAAGPCPFTIEEIETLTEADLVKRLQPDPA